MRGRGVKALRVPVAAAVAVRSGLLLTAVGGVAEAGGAGAGVGAGAGAGVGAGAGGGVTAATAAAAAVAVARDAEVRRPLVLSGGPLSIADIIEVAGHGKPVEISPKARARVAATDRKSVV